MPKIREYRSQVGAAGPIDQPRAQGESMGALGRGLESFGNAVSQVGDIVQRRAEQDEISTASRVLAEKQAEWSEGWREKLTKADPNDSTLADRFNEDVGNQLSELEGSFSTRAGQDYFRNNAAKIQASFFETSYAGQAQLAGIKAREDLEKAHGARAAALMNDPSSFQTNLDLMNADLEARVSTGQLPSHIAEQARNKMTQSLVKASVRGWIELDPVDAEKQIASGKYDAYIDEDLKKQLVGEAKLGIRAAEEEQRRREAELERAKVQKQEEWMNKAFVGIQNNEFNPKSLNASPLDYGQRVQVLNLYEHRRENRGKVRTDPAALREIVQGIHASPGDLNKIDSEDQLLPYFYRNRISFEDLNKMRGELQGKKTEAGKMESELKGQFFKIASARLVKINPFTGMRDVTGESAYQAFLVQFYQEYEDKIKKGKTPQELLNPNSPDYLGYLIDNNSKTMTEILSVGQRSIMDPKSLNQPMTKKVIEPRKPNESIEDYEKRKSSGVASGVGQ